METDIESLLAAVVTAMQPEKIFRVIADDLTPTPTVNEVAAVLRLLSEPALHFHPGQDPHSVLDRIRLLAAEDV